MTREMTRNKAAERLLRAAQTGRAPMEADVYEALATERRRATRATVERVRVEAEQRFGLDPFFQAFLDDLATADVDEEVGNG